MGQGLTPFYKAVHKMNRVPTLLQSYKNNF